MAFGDERQRGRGKRQERDRRAGTQRLPPSLEPPPEVGDRSRPPEAATTTAETAPCPGRRTVPQQTAQSKASPTAGASHDQRRTPQSAIAAWPIASEAAQTASTAA